MCSPFSHLPIHFCSTAKSCSCCVGEGQASRVLFKLPMQIQKRPADSTAEQWLRCYMGQLRLHMPAYSSAQYLTHPAALLQAGLLLAMFTSAVGRAGLWLPGRHLGRCHSRIQPDIPQQESCREMVCRELQCSSCKEFRALHLSDIVFS